MRSPRHVILFFWILFLVPCNVLPALAAGNNLIWNQIPAESLTADGKARVIVGIAVEKYADLAAASAQYKVVTPDEAKTERPGAKAADAALEAAVTRAGDAVLAALPAGSYTVNRTYSALPFVALAVTPEALEALRANPGVTSIEIDDPLPVPDPVPGDPGAKGESGQAAPSVKGSNLNWGPPKVGADVAWDQGYTGAGWYVAVLDTGIRRTHEFFAGKTIVEACYSLNANCPGGKTSAFGPGSAVHYASTYASYDHGTHCAGIAAGKKADGTVAGVAKDADLIAIQVFSKTGTTSIGSYSSDQLAALNYVYSLRNTMSIAAASMSLGGGSYSSPCDSATQKAGIDLLRSVNIATAIATGNDGYCGSIASPACISTAIAVGSSTSADAESSFNNWHPDLQTIFAPGSGIYSSTGGSDTSYASWNGTSMATPHVAGAWAILRQNRPNDSVSDILARVLEAGTPIVTGCGTGKSRPRLYIPSALVINPTPGGGCVNLMPLDIPAVFCTSGGSTNGFNEQFTNTLANWTQHGASWHIGSGYASITGTSSARWSSMSYNTASFFGLDYSVRMRRATAQYDANAIFVRGTPTPLDSLNRWYSGYYFGYTNNGSYQVGYSSNGGVFTSLTGWVSNSAIVPYGWNTLRVMASGTSLTFYINGTQVYSVSDGTFSCGAVGFGRYDGDGGTLDVDYATLSTVTSAKATDPTPARGVPLSGGDDTVSP